MISRIAGAALRAFLVVVLIASPSLVLPGTTSDAAQIVTLVAIFGAGLTFFEYVSAYPGLVEFRDAPPFNRIRFGSLLLTVILLALIARGQIAPTPTAIFVEELGATIGRVIDFPYSPVRLVVLMLPPEASVKHVEWVRNSAGVAYLISLLTLGFFLVVQPADIRPHRRRRCGGAAGARCAL